MRAFRTCSPRPNCSSATSLTTRKSRNSSARHRRGSGRQESPGRAQGGPAHESAGDAVTRLVLAVAVGVLLVQAIPLSRRCASWRKRLSRSNVRGTRSTEPPKDWYCSTHAVEEAKRCACHKVDTDPLCEGVPSEDNARGLSVRFAAIATAMSSVQVKGAERLRLAATSQMAHCGPDGLRGRRGQAQGDLRRDTVADKRIDMLLWTKRVTAISQERQECGEFKRRDVLERFERVGPLLDC